MSEELQRGMNHPSLPSQPPSGHGFVPERFTYIPNQERNLQFHQHNISPHHHATPSPLHAGGDSRLPTPFPLPPPPPPVNQHNVSVPPPHYQGQPPPTFSRPPPPVPPLFSQPPPAMPHTPGIAFQAVQAPPMMAPMASNPEWHPHNPPPMPQCPQALGLAPNTSLSDKCTASMEQEEEDLRWLKEFEKRVMSCPPPPPSPLTESTKTRMDVKLAEVQRLVQESHSLMEQLRALEKELTQVSNTADEEEWNRIVEQAETVKLNLNQILENFQDQKFVEHAKTLLRQRRAKRNRNKQRKKERILEKEQVRREREEKEAKIDAWRTKLQREQESKRREEAVKQEADSILGEVRQKQSEAQKMLQLVEALTALRQARATQAASQGQPRDIEAEQRFTATTELLTEAVKKQLKEYKLEEQTLRVMMEESASHRSAALSVKGEAAIARFQDNVRKLLFGPAATHKDTDLSVEQLVQRRDCQRDEKERQTQQTRPWVNLQCAPC